jgi:hypothetical protein
VVAVGGTHVAVGGTGVSVGASVGVGGMGVAVGGCGVAVGVTTVAVAVRLGRAVVVAVALGKAVALAAPVIVTTGTCVGGVCTPGEPHALSQRASTTIKTNRLFINDLHSCYVERSNVADTAGYCGWSSSHRIVLQLSP